MGQVRQAHSLSLVRPHFPRVRLRRTNDCYSGGMQPYVGKDLLQFPLAHPSDGLLDIVVQEVVSLTMMPIFWVF